MSKNLIMADVHSNLVALRAVLDDAGPTDDTTLYCLGDVVGYGPAPNECLKLLRDHDARILAGNHDAAACGRMDTRYFNQFARRAVDWTAEELTETNRQHLRELPETIRTGTAAFYHGSPLEPLTEYVTTDRQAATALDAADANRLAVGHTHQPILYREHGETLKGEPIAGGESYYGLGSGDRIVLNPGSVGQPRDGDPRAAYVTVEGDLSGTVDLHWHRVEYDVATAQEEIRAAGLPDPLAERLAQGR